MVLITLNIPQDIKERLSLTENKSKLVSDLLREYFLDDKSINYEQRLKELEEAKKMQIEIIEREKQKIMGKYAIEQKERNIKIERIEAEEEKNKEFENNVKKNFLEIMNREMTKEEFCEFWERWENEDNFNLYVYTDEIGSKTLQKV
jgi:hypothetical protein